FGGMGIVARCADHIVISDIGRLAMSGPEVIEASHGVDEFDSRDRALVWRTTGGKHRYLVGDSDDLVDDDVAAFRAAAIAALNSHRPHDLSALENEHSLLFARLVDGNGAADAVGLWQALGVADAALVPDMNAASVRALRPARQEET
ncbi:MAG: biotin-independent malonate decarboxylase subunit beta, partial [Rubrivivax sp.]